VRNVADPGFLSYGLAHGDFFGHGHDVNLPGSATCAEIARPKGMFRIYHRSADLIFSYRPVIHRSLMTTSLFMRNTEDV
jgi:hypothetical protein